MSHDADQFIAPPCSAQVDVLFEDEYLVVVNKPSGLLSLSGKHPSNLDSVHYRLVQHYPTASMLHRLDLGTSGLMILALNKAVNAHLTKQFQARSITKTYEAILFGDLPNDRGHISAPIARGEFPYQKVCETTGKHAVSPYQVIERTNGTTRVAFTPATGRTHQLRVHSQYMGYPIMGCDLYGLAPDGTQTARLADRLQLHARDISFVHPVSGQNVYFESRCPF